MGVFAAVKKNKIGAVIISVFDWYRMFEFSKFNQCLRADHSLQHRITQQKKRSYFASLTWLSSSSAV
jgi:chloramphenicol O-acetyltransferase